VTLGVFFDSADRARERTARDSGGFHAAVEEQARYIEKSLSRLQAGWHCVCGLRATPPSWKEQLLAAAFDVPACRIPGRARAEFERRRDEARSRVTLLAQEIARLAGTILAEHAALQKKLQQTSKRFPSLAEISVKARPGFSPRVHRADALRALQQLPALSEGRGPAGRQAESDPAATHGLRRKSRPCARNGCGNRRKQAKSGSRDPLLEQFRWLLEELRVQLFAQELKTSVAGFGQATVEDVANYFSADFHRLRRPI